MSSKISKSLAKPKRSKSKRGRGKNVTKTKVVVRRLPPLIPENLFFESVKQWVNEETCAWSRFHQGRISKSKNKESIFSRAYFHFKTVEQVLEFHRGYDNHLFIDRQGNENRAVVEFSIYQKLPKEHKKPDPRQGTIETDPDYLAFLEYLKADEIQQATAKEPSVSLENGATQLERLEARLANAAINANVTEKPTTTPLLEHLRAMKLGSKSKSPPQKQAQIAILSQPGLTAKGSGSRAAKQSQARAAQANESSQFNQSTYKSTRRERKRKEREKERERERERREKEKEREKREKDRKNEEGSNKDIEKEKDRKSEEADIGKSKEKTKEQGKEKENHREKDRERDRERRREKRSERDRQRPQTEELKSDVKEKEKETKRAPVKITIQQRQKEQIRQFIQKTNTPLKKESNTTEDDLKDTAHNEPAIKESVVTVQKDVQKDDDKEKNITEASTASSGTSKAHTNSSNVSENRNRRRDRKHSTDVKPPVQIQILTKPQTQSTNTSESNVTTSTSSTASSSAVTNVPSSIRRTGRGYFGKRGGRW